MRMTWQRWWWQRWRRNQRNNQILWICIVNRFKTRNCCTVQISFLLSSRETLLTSSSNQGNSKWWTKETMASPILNNSNRDILIIYKVPNKCSRVFNNNNNRIYTSNSSNKCYISSNNKCNHKIWGCNKWDKISGWWEDRTRCTKTSRTCNNKSHRYRFSSSRKCRIRKWVRLLILTSETFMNWWYLCRKVKTLQIKF